MLQGAARLFTLGAGVLLILVGAVYAVSVFLSVGSLLKNPAALAGPLETFKRLIGADKLVLNAGGQVVEVGGMAAIGILFLWYVFWAWIPLALIAAGGRLVAACSQLRDTTRR